MFGSRFTVVPKHNLDTWCETAGFQRLPDDVGEILAEDVTYRIREAVHNAMQVMKHCKRTCLTVDDFNNALKECDSEPIFGHGGPDSLTFKTISYKDSRLCYVDEKDINLRETALDTVYPADPGDMTLKANWLVLEGNMCLEGKPREDPAMTTLERPLQLYLDNVTTALVGDCNELRKVALKDLAVNKKLQILLPYFLSFFSDLIKQHTNKKSFVRLSKYLLLAINALVENSSILLTPYVFQLVKMMLFVIIEAKISVDDWQIKNKAAHVLAYLCRTCTTTLCNLTNQLLKSYQDSLNDVTKPLSYLYGAIVGIKVFGSEAIQAIIYPVFKDKLQLLEDVIQSGNINKVKEVMLVKDAICETLSILLVDMPIKKNIDYPSLYGDMYNIYGEKLFSKCYCGGKNINQAPLMKGGSGKKNGFLVKLVRSTSLTAELIQKEIDNLKQNENVHITKQEVANDLVQLSVAVQSDKVSFKVKLINKSVSNLSIFNRIDELDFDELETPAKKRKLHVPSNTRCRLPAKPHFSYTTQAKKLRLQFLEDTGFIYSLFL